jgi:hypothetical protein
MSVGEVFVIICLVLLAGGYTVATDLSDNATKFWLIVSWMLVVLGSITVVQI